MVVWYTPRKLYSHTSDVEPKVEPDLYLYVQICTYIYSHTPRKLYSHTLRCCNSPLWFGILQVWYTPRKLYSHTCDVEPKVKPDLYLYVVWYMYMHVVVLLVVWYTMVHENDIQTPLGVAIHRMHILSVVK